MNNQQRIIVNALQIVERCSRHCLKHDAFNDACDDCITIVECVEHCIVEIANAFDIDEHDVIIDDDEQ